jgi:hypothetical protein
MLRTGNLRSQIKLPQWRASIGSQDKGGQGAWLQIRCKCSQPGGRRVDAAPAMRVGGMRLHEPDSGIHLNLA